MIISVEKDSTERGEQITEMPHEIKAKQEDNRDALLDRFLSDLAVEVPDSFRDNVLDIVKAEKNRRKKKAVFLRRFSATAAGLILTVFALVTLSGFPGQDTGTVYEEDNVCDAAEILSEAAPEKDVSDFSGGNGENIWVDTAPPEAATMQNEIFRSDCESETGLSSADNPLYGKAVLSAFDGSGLIPALTQESGDSLRYYYAVSDWDNRCEIEMINPEGKYILIIVTG